MGPVEQLIRKKLQDTLYPLTLEVTNDSDKHAHHRGAKEHALARGSTRGPSETHFSIHVVSAAFEGQRLIQRHRLVNNVLKDELAGPVHALALSTKTPAEAESA